jgi:hypothetical protein
MSFLGFSIPASAATVLVSISGTVTNSVGYSPFGGPGINLVGLPFLATISYDPTIGYRETTATSDFVNGGVVGSDPSPSKGASLTLNGTTINIPGISDAGFTEVNETGSAYSYYALMDEWSHPSGTAQAVLNFFIWHPFSPTSDLDNPYTGSGLSGFGQFAFMTTANGFANHSVVQFDNFSVSSSTSGTGAPGAVPEPAAWAMMIAGFGLVGAALRRHRISPPKLRGENGIAVGRLS